MRLIDAEQYRKEFLDSRDFEPMKILDLQPTVNAIPLDKVKKAREKMESKLYVGTEETTGLVCLDLGVTMCLEILDELIESEGKK